MVVIAVGSFAAFLSYTQSTAQNRSSHITSVQDEDLQITSISPGPYYPNVQYEMTCNGTAAGSYYLQIVLSNSSEVELLNPSTSGTLANLVNAAGNSVEYNAISPGVVAGFNGSSPIKIDNATTNCIFENPSWQTVVLTIRNLNTQDSGLSSISINNIFLNFSALGQPSIVNNYQAPLVIPGQAPDVSVVLNVTGRGILETSPINIILLSSAGNFFSGVFTPPIPVVTVNTQTENYQIASRDVPFVDGSGSNATSYLWEILIPTDNWTPSQGWSSSNISVVFVQSRSFQYRPEALLSSSLLNSSLITGPVQVTLLTTNSEGLLSISQPSIIPTDPNIAPEGSLRLVSVSCNSTFYTNIIIDSFDIFGRALSGAPVVFTPIESNGPADLVLSNYFGTTVNGQISTTVDPVSGACATGFVEVESGNLPPTYVSLPG